MMIKNENKNTTNNGKENLKLELYSAKEEIRKLKSTIA